MFVDDEALIMLSNALDFMRELENKYERKTGYPKYERELLELKTTIAYFEMLVADKTF